MDTSRQQRQQATGGRFLPPGGPCSPPGVESAGRGTSRRRLLPGHLEDQPWPRVPTGGAPAQAVAPLQAAMGAGPGHRLPRPQGHPGRADRSAVQGTGCPGPPAQGRQSPRGPKSSWGPAGQTKAEAFGMRQAPPHSLQLPFRSISHDSLGRTAYLRERHRQKPEKFPYPVLSSWEYGRHVGDIVKDAGAPPHASSQPIAKSFYIKGSVFHFPRANRPADVN